MVSVLQEKTNYKSILYKTYFVMEYAVAHYDVRFVLKTDDDAFINVQPLIQQLKLLCETPDCQNERMYMVSFISCALTLCRVVCSAISISQDLISLEI